MPTLALLLAATPPPTAEDIMAAHRARMSVAALEAQGAAERERRCANAQAGSADEVVVCGQRDDGRYRVPASPEAERGPGLGGLRTVEAAQAAAPGCGIGANLCEKPVFDGGKALDFVIKLIRHLTDGE